MARFKNFFPDEETILTVFYQKTEAAQLPTLISLKLVSGPDRLYGARPAWE